MEDKAWVTPDQVTETFIPKVDNRGRYHFAEAVLLTFFGHLFYRAIVATKSSTLVSY